ncbi:hypothetical protein MKEN_01177400 [Mycena kentingensis (nom. inval.)]|nr:hypothetical protein MKEN_01177400 [Mycena kentingensis (nom. inval.)]
MPAEPSLKRSASAASLPTPPPTTHKRKRSSSPARSDGDIGSDDEDIGLEERVRRAEAEEHFWLSHNNASSSPPLVYKLLPVTLPASPPPSPLKQTLRSPYTPTRSAAPSPPATPPPPKRAKHNLIPTDSPHNPFLASPLGPKDEIVATTSRVIREERPTMEYVFRGVRRSFPNPYYGKPVPPNSLLPPEHPDYEHDEQHIPKLVFGLKQDTTINTRRTAPTVRSFSVEDSDD